MNGDHFGCAEQGRERRIQRWDQPKQQCAGTLKQKEAPHNECIPVGRSCTDGTCLHEILVIFISRAVVRPKTAACGVRVNASQDSNASMPVVAVSQKNQSAIEIGEPSSSV